MIVAASSNRETRWPMAQCTDAKWHDTRTYEAFVLSNVNAVVDCLQRVAAGRHGYAGHRAAAGCWHGSYRAGSVPRCQ
jgi:hypothetical protein